MFFNSKSDALKKSWYEIWQNENILNQNHAFHKKVFIENHAFYQKTFVQNHAFWEKFFLQNRAF